MSRKFLKKSRTEVLRFTTKNNDSNHYLKFKFKELVKKLETDGLVKKLKRNTRKKMEENHGR